MYIVNFLLKIFQFYWWRKPEFRRKLPTDRKSLASVKSTWFMSESIVRFKRPENLSWNLNWKKISVREWKCSGNINFGFILSNAAILESMQYDHQTQFWKRTIPGILHPVVLDRIKVWKVNGRWVQDDNWLEELTGAFGHKTSTDVSCRQTTILCNFLFSSIILSFCCSI
jgi:hypothetical protein